MKVVHVVNRLDNNGVTRAVVNLSKQLSEQGIESHVILLKVPQNLFGLNAAYSLLGMQGKSTHDAPERVDVKAHFGRLKQGLKNCFVPFRRFAKYSIGGLWAYQLRAKRYSRLLDNDIASIGADAVFLHCHYSKVLFSQVNFGPCYRVLHNKKSLQLQGKWWLPTALNIKIMAHVLRDKPKLAVSKAVKNDLRRNLNVTDDDIDVIPNIYDAAHIRSSASEAFDFDKYNLRQGNFFLALGRLELQKRYDRLLRAYAQSHPTIPLVIVGKGSLEGRLVKQAADLGIADKVHFFGHFDNPYPLLRHARALILSSDYEGLPTVLIEALFLDTPIIATACSGVREAVAGSHKATLVAVRNEQRLSQAITWHALRNIHQLSPLCTKVQINYNAEQIARRYARLVANDQ